MLLHFPITFVIYLVDRIDDFVVAISILFHYDRYYIILCY